MAEASVKTLTFEKVRHIIPDTVTLVEGLLFAPFPKQPLTCTLLNEDVMIVGFVKSGTICCTLNGTAYLFQ